jgi:hypothetical protein
MIWDRGARKTLRAERPVPGAHRRLHVSGAPSNREELDAQGWGMKTDSKARGTRKAKAKE